MFQSALVTSSTYFLAYGKSALIAMAGQSKQAKKVYRPSLKDSLPAEEVLWINSCDSYNVWWESLESQKDVTVETKCHLAPVSPPVPILGGHSLYHYSLTILSGMTNQNCLLIVWKLNVNEPHNLLSLPVELRSIANMGREWRHITFKLLKPWTTDTTQKASAR